MTSAFRSWAMPPFMLDFTLLLGLLPLVGFAVLAYRLRRDLLSPLPIAILTIGWLLSGWLLVAGARDRSRQSERAFADLALEAQDAVQDRMNTYVEALRAGASFMAAAPAVGRETWATFAATLDLPGRYPGINGIGVIFPVERGDSARHEQQQRDDGDADFTVHDVPDVEPLSRPDRAIITFIAPVAGNEPARGLDVGSEITRREAAEQARDTGEPRVTRRIRLVQDAGGSAGFLLYVPVYENQRPVGTVAERRAAFRAWVYAPFVTGRFLEGVLGTRTRRIQLHLFEGSRPDPSLLLYSSTQRTDLPASFARTTSLTLAGQPFVLGWNPAEGSAPTPASPLTWIGLVAALVTVWIVSAVVNERDLRRRVQVLVAERTQAIGESERRYRALVERLPEPTIVIRDEKLVYLNPSALTLFGARSQAELVGTPMLDRLHPDSRALAVGRFRALASGSVTRTPLVEMQLLRLDGSVADVESQGTVIDYDGVPAVQVAVHDVTERKAAQRQVRETEARYERLFEQMLSSLLVFEAIVDADGRPYDHRLLYANPAFEAQTGLSRQEQVGRTSADLGFKWPADVAQRLYQVALTGTPIRYERFNESLGRYFEVRAFSPQKGQFAMSSNDISERKRAEAALTLRSAALDAAANVIIITDRQGIIEWVNRAFTLVTGYSLDESVGRSPGALLKSGRHDDAFYQRLWAAIGAGSAWTAEIVNRRKDGSQYPSDVSITPVTDADGRIQHFIAVEQDITERLRLEEQFRQAQKMESIGRLAGGVAHDFNNMLGVILGFSELAMAQLPPDSAVQSDLREIRGAASRSAELTRQLLTFARRQSVSPEVLDINAVVERSLRMLERLIGEHIHLDWQPSSSLWPVFMDSTQVDQILANLSVNARDAIGSVGSLTIATANCIVDAQTAALYPDAVPGEYVRLTASDTGCGMSPEVIAHIFEPFFTTKKVGEGTGLGLATVYGAVRQGGGFIAVESAVGRGTTFSVYLPRFVGKAEADEPRAGSTDAPRGGETVLIVEDEPRVLKMAVRGLERLGYHVIAANSPDEAMALGASHEGRIDLLLTDLVMPGMNGRELAERFRQRYPRVGQLFMSGYPADASGTAVKLGELEHFIAKPFTLTALADAVRRALDG